MCEARRKWEEASDEFKQAAQLFEDLERNTDGITAMKLACTHEITALRNYRNAVEAYAQAVRHGDSRG